jgi:hypothetical protein
MTVDTDQKLDTILIAIKSLEARVARIENSGTGRRQEETPVAPSKKLSIKEFLLENPPTTDIQRTLAVGYFLETHAGMTSFTKIDLEKGYSDAREPTPSNMGVNIRHCIKQGHMMESEDKKNNKTAYVVTRGGEQFVMAKYKKSAGSK